MWLVLFAVAILSVVYADDDDINTYYLSNCTRDDDCDGFVCKNKICVECTDYKSCNDRTLNCFNEDYNIKNVNGTVVEEELGTCSLKRLFHPFTWEEIVATVLAFFGGSLASSSGIGGGGIYIPLYVLVAGYEYSNAVSFSSVTIFGSAISNVGLLLFQSHPTLNRPLIDFNLVLVYEPVVLAGTTIGVLMNELFPDWLITVLLVIVLVVCSSRTCCKGYQNCKMVLRENRERKREEELEGEDGQLTDDEPSVNTSSNDQHSSLVLNTLDPAEYKDFPAPGPGETSPLIQPEQKQEEDQHQQKFEEESGSLYPPIMEYDEKKGEDEGEDDEFIPPPVYGEDDDGQKKDDDNDKNKDEDEKDEEEEEEHLKSITKRKKRQVIRNKDKSTFLWFLWCFDTLRVPCPQLIILIFVWIIVVLCAFFKGSSSQESVIGIEVCSAGYWILTFIDIPIFITISYIIGIFCFALHCYKIRRCDYVYEKLEVKWNCCTGVASPIFFLAAGISAGLLGLGGGTIVAPLLIEIGVSPDITSGTSSLMVLFTSCSTMLQYAFLGRMPYDYSLWYASFGFLSAIIGRVLISIIVKKLKGSYFIAYVIGFTLGICAILMGTIGLKSFIENIVQKDWENLKFHSVC